MSKGKVLFEMAPYAGHPRSSEGAFLETERGLMFAYTAFVGDAARDHTAANVAVVFSKDGGHSFTQPRTVVYAKDHEAMNVMSVSLLRLQDNSIGMFFLIRKDFELMLPHIAISHDEGLTFGPPRPCAHRVSYMVMNNDRVVRLPGGRIVLPMAEHRVLAPKAGIPDFHPGTLTFLYSDDDGQSFQEARTPLSLDSPYTKAGLQEPGCVALADGLLYGWARTDRGYQYEMYSRDGGITWSAPRASVFTAPLSPLSMKRLPDGRLFTVWNPIPTYQTRMVDPRTGGRTPLVYALSEDDGLSWSQPVVIEEDPRGGYCYCAIHVGQEQVLLAYCAGDPDKDGSCLNRLRMRAIRYDDMEMPARFVSPEGAMGIGLTEE